MPAIRKIQRYAAVYFFVQGVAVIAWWVALYAFPSVRRPFLLESDSEISLMAFWIADLSLLGIGSLWAGWLLLRRSEYIRVAVWFVTGAISYATLYCFAFALFTDIGWLGVTLMFPAMIWSGVFAVGVTFEREMFRRAAEASTAWIVVKTITQIVVVWSIILVVFPYLISIVEDKLGIARVQFEYQRLIAAVLFVLVSSIGVWAAVTMSRIGRGTPLPLDHAVRLVATGPYAYVRNPMAVSGIGQGLAVALYLGSPLVVIYSLMGSLIWQLIFRPLEEEDLERRFGREYDDYRREVKCWIPRLAPYQMDGAADSSISIERPSGSR